MRRKISFENQTTITLSIQTKDRLEAFRDSFKPSYRYQNWDELLEMMLDYLEKAIPDTPDAAKPSN